MCGSDTSKTSASNCMKHIVCIRSSKLDNVLDTTFIGAGINVSFVGISIDTS